MRQSKNNTEGISIIVPALNEAGAIVSTVQSIKQAFSDVPHEVIVIDDGSRDDTGKLAAEAGALVIRHPAPGGYGNALKAGICASSFDFLAITDADATYPIADLPKLYHAVAEEGFHMAVGARTGRHYHGSFWKLRARKVFKWLAEFSTGRQIPDINSGMRVFRKQDIDQFFHSLCNGFSFTTTITLAYMHNGYFIKYMPIEYYKRDGKSKVRHFRDSLGSLQIITQSIIYYNPLKIYIILAILFSMASAFTAPFVFWNPLLALLMFGFASVTTLLLGLGFLAVGVSQLTDINRAPQERGVKHSHHITNCCFSPSGQRPAEGTTGQC